ncbi:MAG: hypothetical protein QOE03_564 [Micromonosporaceae bacterium]|jgi:uncharacterized protein YukE|nr:hypothetical protein [Micromonosporaceae bacterium]
MYGDPDELDRLAGQLRAGAAEVRRHAGDQVRRAQAAHWVSSAAERYRDQLAADRRAADRVADQLERAARQLVTHAQRVRESIARMARYERAATASVGRSARSSVRTVEHAVDSATRTANRLIADA